MNKAQAYKWLVSIGIVPVIRASSAEQALTAINAVCKGGISVLEVTMTVPGANKLIENVRKSMGDDVLVGAGTILDADSARQSLDSGAQFLVSPGFDEPTIAFAKSKNVLMVAGALTPTETISVWKAGADLIKIFPCSAVGGASYIKALKGPLPHIPLIPTGGVNLKTAADFIKAGSEALGIGGELILASALKAGTPQVISDLARQYLAIIQEVRNESVAAATSR
jgi:2-dehydro-3-deoxyphosphogluconate aldolase / (4S)-4-hydroxy-2-oxoglutarate aldolase